MSAQNTINAIYAFLDKFQYVDDKGKRAKTNRIQTFFSNKELTADLVKDAVDLAAHLRTLLKSNPPHDVMLAQFKKYITDAYAAAVKQRDERAPTEHTTISRSDPAISPFEITMYGPHEITYFDSHKPYAAGKFEKELIAGLTAAKECLESEGKTFCEDKIKEIRSYNPKEIISNERTYNTGIYYTLQR